MRVLNVIIRHRKKTVTYFMYWSQKIRFYNFSRKYHVKSIC